MKMFQRFMLLGTCLLVVSQVLGAPQSSDWKSASKAFELYCVQCHGAEKQKAKIRLDTLTLNSADKQSFEILWAVLDQLKSEDMPPEDAKQPTAAERRELIASITTTLAAAEKDAGFKSEPTILRRLTRVQYRNTLRDLLGIDVTEDPTATFPGDSSQHGFDTNADSLRISKYLLNSYMKAANWALNAATRNGPRPDTKRVVMSFEKIGGPVAGRDGFADIYQSSKMARNFTAYHARFLWAPFGKDFAPPKGGMKVRIRATVEALNRQPKDLELARQYAERGYVGDRPFALGLHLLVGQGESAKAILLKTFAVPDGERVSIDHTAHIPQSHRLGISFINGPEIRRLDQFLPAMEGLRDKSSWTDKRAYKRAYKAAIAKSQIPKIRIHELSLEGPLHEQWPPASHQTIYGQDLDNAEIVRRFARKAFRRPVKDEVMEPYVAMAGDTPESLRQALVAILCSPAFIYLNEPVGPLDSHAIASRLSYFLWSSMPDEELARLAETDQLRDPEVLTAQMDRLLNDSKSKAFDDEFVEQWLDLGNILEMPPNGKAFREFYTNDLHAAMLDETKLFVRELLDKNLPVGNLIDSDFTFLNADLAKLYGVKSDVGHQFEKVSLKGVPTRGGLLGQGAVLTASANGVDTSPVVRGVWVLENLLGTPPSPPPPGVPAADPDIRGAKTIREILDKHRTDTACNVCHRKIDPHGFALENFDPIGRWRSGYESGLKIESDGQLEGQKFANVTEWKRILRSKEPEVARGLVTKLLEYATGRKMGAADRRELDRLVSESVQTNYGMRDLMKLAVTSPIFLTK